MYTFPSERASFHYSLASARELEPSKLEFIINEVVMIIQLNQDEQNEGHFVHLLKESWLLKNPYVRSLWSALNYMFGHYDVLRFVQEVNDVFTVVEVPDEQHHGTGPYYVQYKVFTANPNVVINGEEHSNLHEVLKPWLEAGVDVRKRKREVVSLLESRYDNTKRILRARRLKKKINSTEWRERKLEFQAAEHQRRLNASKFDEASDQTMQGCYEGDRIKGGEEVIVVVRLRRSNESTGEEC